MPRLFPLRTPSRTVLALWFSFLSLLALLLAPAHATTTVRTDEVRADLLVHAPEGVMPGKPVWLGLQIEHAPHWHTYWRNPGDSGLPTTLAWQLPPGVQAGEIDWPAPQRLPFGPLMNYGYEGTVVLPVPLSLPAGLTADRIDVRLQADWLVCKTECIPQSGEFSLSLPVGPTPQAAHQQAFDASFASRPRVLAGTQGSARVDGERLLIRLQGLPGSLLQAADAQVFPELAGVTEPAAPVTLSRTADTLELGVKLAAQRSASPERLPIVLRLGDAPALAFELPVSGTWPSAAPTPVVSPALQQALDENARRAAAAPAAAAPAGGWAWALLAALAGGMLLNLMPCVFPVLSLKVLGLVHHAPSPQARWQSGAAYTAGVVLSFLALAGLLLMLRAAGEQLGWGFQLQSPWVVATLAVLFTVIGLNLAGVFEFGSVLPSAWASARARHPAVDAFLSGVLAVAVASPCTAPFMGASLGLALTLPAVQALAVFAALGLGMALPYLVVSAWPGLSRWLPRPGAWMAQFKTAMAFPMFATVVWLVWVLGQQSGIDGAAALLAVLVALGFAAWAWAAPGLGRVARLGWGLPAVAALAAALWVGAPLVDPVTAAPRTAGSTSASTDAGWQAWEAGRAEALQTEGRIVFVDFTAAWCVTCQFNKRTTLADAELLADFNRRGVVLMRADWTRRDPDITQALARLGRSGVPVYALYRAGQPPVVLSEILSVQDVRAALASL